MVGVAYGDGTIECLNAVYPRCYIEVDRLYKILVPTIGLSQWFLWVFVAPTQIWTNRYLTEDKQWSKETHRKVGTTLVVVTVANCLVTTAYTGFLIIKEFHALFGYSMAVLGLVVYALAQKIGKQDEDGDFSRESGSCLRTTKKTLGYLLLVIGFLNVCIGLDTLVAQRFENRKVANILISITAFFWVCMLGYGEFVLKNRDSRVKSG
jgi:succinate dehydrogenase hydrophobic anchor subunit